ncbi:hypothetical protein LXL04_028510 [Taraxacum kok-saghyz]
MEIEKIDEGKGPRVSGAYIRSLVKHLTAKDPADGGSGSPENENQFSDDISNNQKQQKPKKQVRRRLHTSKPYQERLLNMAEARREIVTALKFHRASMKQQQTATAATNHHPLPVQERKPKSTTTTANLYWPITATAPPLPPAYNDNLNLFLPSQTLGLNLNFENFENLDSTCFYNTQLSMPSSSTSSSAPVAGKQTESYSGGLHHAMGDEEMEEIRLLGEKHQIEWNDTINLMTSARWCSFLKNMEMEEDEGDEFYGFDQVMEFPIPNWLINGNESSCLQDHNYLQDPALPCIDIGEIEGMDGEWLP